MKSVNSRIAVLFWSIAGTASLLGCIEANAAITSWSSTNKVAVTDPQYQMTAYTLAVPAGWKFAGTVARSQGGCHAIGGVPKFTIQSPDGITAILLMPGVRWNWSSNNTETPNCRDIDIDTAAGFLVNIAIPHLVPNARIVSILPLPPAGRTALADQLEQARQQEAAGARRYGIPPTTITLDGARVRIQYDHGGQQVEEMISSIIKCNESQQPAMFRRPAFRRRTCFSRNVVIARAPIGHLDALMAQPQFAALNHSLQFNPDWQRRVQHDQQAAFQHWQVENARQNQIIKQHFADVHSQLLNRGAQFQKQLAASTNSALQADRNAQAAIDKSAHRQSLESLNQQEFTDPNTGRTVKLSNQYNHQWISSDGSTTIQNQDHSYDPNGRVYPGNQSWVELVPKQ